METEKKKVTAGKLAAAVAVVVFLIAALIALVMAGMAQTSQVDTEAEAAEVVYTIPADGNASDETAKGTYTADDTEVLAARETVVARMGDHTLTNGQLQAYYWMEFQNFMNNYGSYISYFGLDYTKPLDMQVCPISENGGTWQQFFLASALNTWKNYQALSVEAENAGFALEADAQAQLDGMEESLAQDAVLYGMESGEELLAAIIGHGATMDDYAHYLGQSYLSMAYFNDLCEANKPSDAEMEAYFTEHEADYEANGVNREDTYVNVRHILIMPEGATSATIRTEEFGEEAWAASKEKADALLAEFEAGDKSELSFAALAAANSQDGSAADGGLIEDVTKGVMVANFEKWCFDESRKYGDYELIETEFGYHLMYFVSTRPIWREAVEQEMMTNISSDLLNEVRGRYAMEAEFDKILLGYVNLGGDSEQIEAVQPQSLFDEAHLPIVIIAGVSLAGLVAAAYVFQKREEEV